MFEIWKWLNGDKDYFQGIELMGKYCPNHSLLESLRTGTMSDMNRIYLKTILKKRYEELKANPNEKTKVATKVAPSTPSVKKTIEKKHNKQFTQEDFKRIADKELAAAYAERRRLSNQLHHCNTDLERAAVSDAIKECIENINNLKSRISVYNATGVMPKKIEVKGFEVPTDKLELTKLITNYRSKVSTQKKLIRDYDNQPRKKTKAEHELYLRELERKLKILKDAR